MINLRDYRASKQVSLLVDMINESRIPHSGVGESERRFHDGTRHGMNVVLRALVELETGINDPELIDDACADLITEALINKC
jgi:hypothetical protein